MEAGPADAGLGLRGSAELTGPQVENEHEPQVKAAAYWPPNHQLDECFKTRLQAGFVVSRQGYVAAMTAIGRY